MVHIYFHHCITDNDCLDKEMKLIASYIAILQKYLARNIVGGLCMTQKSCTCNIFNVPYVCTHVINILLMIEELEITIYVFDNHIFLLSL